PAAPAVSCPALQAPAGGRKFGTKYLVEHEVHFACNPGFELLGSSTRTCQANGSWSGQEPRCTGLWGSSACGAALCPSAWACWVQLQEWGQSWLPDARGTVGVHQRGGIAAVPGRCSLHGSGLALLIEKSRRKGAQQHRWGAKSASEGSLRCSKGIALGQQHRVANSWHLGSVNVPWGYSLLADGKSCEDIDECALSQDNCTQGTTCINTGGGFQCVHPECPQPGGNVTYVKTSPFQCERNPCPMDSRSCHQAPKTISFHYLPLPSNLLTPTPLFRMATDFVMQRSDRQTGELILVQSLKGPQTIQVDVDMSEYHLDRTFQAKHLSKITVFVSAYEF
ncbi:Fibulin-7, partial [Anas platyrhynchos]